MDQKHLEIKLSEQDVERFWKKVAKAGPDECWLWMAGKRKQSRGYGGFRIGGKVILAHRVAFILSNRLEPGQDVLHKCDMPPCCNPRHLYAGTQNDNMHDAVSKGRLVTKRGEESPHAKVTQAQVDEIRRLYAEAHLTQRDIARMFRISYPNIWHIVHRKTWV